MSGSTASPSSDAHTTAPQIRRRLPIGAEYLGGGRTHFRVWAPAARRLAVVLEGEERPLEPESDGYFSGTLEASPGGRYQFRIDDGDGRYPDPASRFQPDGPHGPSEIIDPGAFDWTDASWRGVSIAGQIVYELHVGTFTRDGSWTAAARELEELASIGITTVEVMPVAEFPGRFGWGR